MKKIFLLITILLLSNSCVNKDYKVYMEQNEIVIDSINKEVDFILKLTRKKLGSEIGFDNIKKYYKLIKKHKNLKNNSKNNDSLISLTNNYIKKSNHLINSLLQNIILENNATIKRNVYIHFQILETIKHHSIAEKKLNAEINDYNSKFWFESLFKRKSKTLYNKKAIIDSINSLSLETLLNKKYTYNREWSLSKYADSKRVKLKEFYFRNKDRDTLISQEIEYYEGVIDSMASDFYKTEINKINDTTYNGKITVFNSSIHSLGLKIYKRNLELILLPDFKIIKSKNSNTIKFSIKNDTLSGLLQDRCFFHTDSIDGQPMLRLISHERPLDNKYKTNNGLIKAFEIMKNER